MYDVSSMPAGDHIPRGSLRAPDSALDIYIEYLINVLRGSIDEWCEGSQACNARVVHEYVDAAEAVHHGCHHSLHGMSVADVRAKALGIRQSFGCFRGLIRCGLYNRD